MKNECAKDAVENLKKIKNLLKREVLITCLEIDLKTYSNSKQNEE